MEEKNLQRMEIKQEFYIIFKCHRRKYYKLV